MTQPVLDNLERCFDSFDALLDGLTDEQWATPSLCPGWTVGGVVAHLGAIEHMLLDKAPGSMVDSLPFELVGEWLASVESLSNAEFLERYRATIAARRAELVEMTDEQLALPSATPVGPGTYGRFMAVRVFDFWVHEQDVRVPLGLPGHEAGPAAEMAIDEIHHSLPYIVGKKVGLPDGMTIAFELTGPVVRTMNVAVTGRAGLVDSLDAPDVTLTTDSTTFALLACGRIDPQDPIDADKVSWSGDPMLGEQAARNLRFTM